MEHPPTAPVLNTQSDQSDTQFLRVWLCQTADTMPTATFCINTVCLLGVVVLHNNTECRHSDFFVILLRSSMLYKHHVLVRCNSMLMCTNFFSFNTTERKRMV